MAFPSLARWMTGTIPKKTLRMGDGGMMGRPLAVFAGGANPTTQGGAHGVVGTDDLKVTIQSGLQMQIAVGQCFMLGTSSIDQGVYYGYNGAVLAGAGQLLAAHSGSPRKDVLYVRPGDADEDGGSTGIVADKVTGTPGSGVIGTLPAGALVLAVIDVPATSGAVTVDSTVRPYACALGGLIRCKSTLRPTGVAAWLGQHIYETDTFRELIYNGASWDIITEPAQPITSLTTFQGGGVTNTVTYGWYQRSRSSFIGQCNMAITSTGVAGNSINVASPLTLINAEGIGGSFAYLDATGTEYVGSIYPSATTEFKLQTSGVASRLGVTPSFPMDNGDSLRLTFTGRYA